MCAQKIVDLLRQRETNKKEINTRYVCTLNQNDNHYYEKKASFFWPGLRKNSENQIHES